ncbi:MAG: hypothetical protein RJB66_791 [Pseudomonadota bacterium]
MTQIKKPTSSVGFKYLSGGESGIRTHGPREGSPVFKTGVFNRSTISPSTVLRKSTQRGNLFFYSFCELCRRDAFCRGSESLRGGDQPHEIAIKKGQGVNPWPFCFLGY